MFSRAEDRLAVGYGEVDLEAPLNASMPGYFNDRKATGVIDPLKAKAVFLRLGNMRFSLISLDLIGFEWSQVEACRKAIVDTTDLTNGNSVWIHATHTHTGAMVSRHFTSDAETIAPGVYVGTPDRAWVASLPGKLAKAVKQAQEHAREGEVRLGQTKVEGVAFYRRFKMKDGTVKTNPGYKNPEIVAPAGEIDPTLTAIFAPETKTVVAIYGVHPDVIGGTRYSADYPAFIQKQVSEEMGPEWNVLFLNAACGNINHVDVAHPSQKKGLAESERIGRELGSGIARAFKQSEPMPVNILGFGSRRSPYRLRVVPEPVVKEAERLLKEEPEKAHSFNGIFAPAAVALGRTKDREQSAEISAVRIGPMALVGMPGEIFVELARELQHDSPFEPTRLIGLTNGALGYIPTEAAFAEGGYETGYRSARFEPKTGHKWVAEALKILRVL
jgi:hypothetical protein